MAVRARNWTQRIFYFILILEVPMLCTALAAVTACRKLEEQETAQFCSMRHRCWCRCLSPWGHLLLGWGNLWHVIYSVMMQKVTWNNIWSPCLLSFMKENLGEGKTWRTASCWEGTSQGQHFPIARSVSVPTMQAGRSKHYNGSADFSMKNIGLRSKILQIILPK